MFARSRRRPARLPRATVSAVRRVRELVASHLASESDRELAGRFADLRERAGVQRRLTTARTLQAAALLTEAIRRASGKTLYDVQLAGGLAIAAGTVGQMQTGEGKTITTALGAGLLSLVAPRGVHVATTNAYLAARDCEELRPPLELLGLAVGGLPDPHDPEAARTAYAADVTFGTGYDFGFDLLRDHQARLAHPVPPLGHSYLQRLAGTLRPLPVPMQRGHDAAVVDEADSVLVDEATMPLILAAPGGSPPDAGVLAAAAWAASQLEAGTHYLADEADRTLQLTDAGWRRGHDLLAAARDEHGAIASRLTRPWVVSLGHALRAALFLRRGVDFVVRVAEDGPMTGQPAVQIIDPSTGRIHPERTWQDGLHQAVEQAAGVPLSPETRSDGRISRQRCFGRYTRLAGLTGTAAVAEFAAAYGLPTRTIPTHRPSQRRVLPCRAFGSSHARDAAIAAEVLRRRRRGDGQPILIGARTIAHSEALASALDAVGLAAVVLNGVQDGEEAAIVAAAGQHGALTIATNMAGRGTDIKPDDAALAAGGLHVIVAGPNTSARVDRQLAGRAARQGQPGSVQTFVAGEDELFTLARSRGGERLWAAAAGRRSGEVDAATAAAAERDVAAAQSHLERDAAQRRRRMVQAEAHRDRVMRTLAGTSLELQEAA